MSRPIPCDSWDASGEPAAEPRRAALPVLDTDTVDMHSALVPPGALHQRVTTALASWRLDTAEELLADFETDPSPYSPSPRPATGPVPGSLTDAPLTSLASAWADTLRAELLVRRLRVAGFTLLGDPLGTATGPEAAQALDLHAGVAELLDGPDERPESPPPDLRSESATHAALAIALVRSAKAAFDATDDDLQRAAGLARHARIELLSRRVDAAMDEAVEAASLLIPSLPPCPLLVDTLGTLAGVLADLELMPLALDFQRRAYAAAGAVPPAVPGTGPGAGAGAGPAAEQAAVGAMVGETASRLAELCAELGEGLLDDGAVELAGPHFAEARTLAEQALAELPPGDDGVLAAQVVHGWALVGLGEHAAAVGQLRAAVRRSTDADDRALLASAELGLGRALRRQGDGRAADRHLAQALALATEQALPRLRRSALRELCTLHAELDDAGRALPYLQTYLADELDRVDERRTRWVELFGRRKSLLETERAAGQLRRQAYEDALTHLPNRRYAEARLDGLLATGAAPALAVIDIDLFKAINDAAGHPGGDAVLRAVAQLLLDGCRDTDEVCRWAGDEFVVLLPDTTAEQAERALERIRISIAEHDWSALGIPAPVTVSVGIASAARGDDRRTLFAAADGVLYDAKRSGRDRVVRLSGVTQTRAPDNPVDAPFGPARPAAAEPAAAEPAGARESGAAEPAGAREPGAAAVRVEAVQAHPTTDSGSAGRTRGDAGRDDAPAGPGTREDAGGFARLLVEPPSAVAAPSPAGSPAGPAPVPPPAPAPVAPLLGAPPIGAPLIGAPVPRENSEQVGPDVIWGTGRSTEQVLALVREARRTYPDRPAVVVRASADTLVALATEHDAYTTMDAAAMAAAVGPVPEPRGRVGVLCASPGDLPVAAEAAFVARVTGTEVVRVDDVGGNRIRPLLTDRALLTDVECLVVVAGLDASLASVVGSMTEVPIVAVPTSTGQASSFGGFSALLTMLNSAAPGVVVSNIDNGYAAGVFAARIARRTAPRL